MSLNIQTEFGRKIVAGVPDMSDIINDNFISKNSVFSSEETMNKITDISYKGETTTGTNFNDLVPDSDLHKKTFFVFGRTDTDLNSPNKGTNFIVESYCVGRIDGGHGVMRIIQIAIDAEAHDRIFMRTKQMIATGGQWSDWSEFQKGKSITTVTSETDLNDLIISGQYNFIRIKVTNVPTDLLDESTYLYGTVRVTKFEGDGNCVLQEMTAMINGKCRLLSRRKWRDSWSEWNEFSIK